MIVWPVVGVAQNKCRDVWRFIVTLVTQVNQDTNMVGLAEDLAPLKVKAMNFRIAPNIFLNIHGQAKKN